MAYTGRFDGVDPQNNQKCKITDQRGAWWGYIGRGIDAANIQVGATVEFEVEKVPPSDPAKKPYNRFTKIVAVGMAPPQSMAPVAAAAPRVAAPPAAPAPSYENKDEQIYICGVTNQYVANTGDTAVKSLVEVGLRAREAFQVVFRGKQLAQPVTGYPDDPSAPF
jgi:hypothetical protein